MIYNTLEYITIYFTLGAIVIIFSFWKKYPGNEAIKVLFLALFFRSILTWYYYYYSLTNAADATAYFSFAQKHFQGFRFDEFQPGTAFINNISLLCYKFTSLFNNRYLALYIPFSLLGFWGSILYFKALINVIHGHKRLLYLLAFFIPNQIFWTSNVGKDSIIYLALMGILYLLTSTKSIIYSIPSLIFFGFLCYMVRPHVLFLVLSSFLFAYFLQRRKMGVRNYIILFIFLIAFLAFFNKMTTFAGINLQKDNADAQQSIGNFIHSGITDVESHAKGLSFGGAKTSAIVNPALMPVYFVNFVCMPYIWQVKNGVQFVAAIESMIYQFMLLYIIFNFKFLLKIDKLPNKYAWCIHIIFIGVIFGMAYSNFGLTTRQKCQIVPHLMLLFAAIRAHKTNLRVLKGKKKIQLDRFQSQVNVSKGIL